MMGVTMENNDIHDLLLHSFVKESMKPDADAKQMEYLLDEMEKVNPTAGITFVAMLEDYYEMRKKVDQANQQNKYRKLLIIFTLVCSLFFVLISSLHALGHSGFRYGRFRTRKKNPNEA